MEEKSNIGFSINYKRTANGEESLDVKMNNEMISGNIEKDRAEENEFNYKEELAEWERQDRRLNEDHKALDSIYIKIATGSFALSVALSNSIVELSKAKCIFLLQIPWILFTAIIINYVYTMKLAIKGVDLTLHIKRNKIENKITNQEEEKINKEVDSINKKVNKLNNIQSHALIIALISLCLFFIFNTFALNWQRNKSEMSKEQEHKDQKPKTGNQQLPAPIPGSESLGHDIIRKGIEPSSIDVKPVNFVPKPPKPKK